MAYGTFAFGEKAGQLTPDSINSLKLAISGLNKEQAALALSTRGLSVAQQKQVLVDAGLIATNERISAGIVKQALVTNGLDKEQQEAILTKAGLTHEDSKLLLSGEAVSAQKLKQVLIENGYQAEQAETLINSILQEEQNYKEALSWKVLGTKAKEAAIAMLHNPLTWVVVAIASISFLVKGYDALIGKQEKLSRQKIEGLDEDILKLDEEIRSLEELQSKLEDAKGSRYELSQIQTELNDAIGETKGLLNGESKAWDVANTKLKANIELKKQQRKQAQQDKVNDSKALYDNNTFEKDWAFDISGEQMRGYGSSYVRSMEWYNSQSENSEVKQKYKTQQEYSDFLLEFLDFNPVDWEMYWKEQVDTAYDVFEDTINSYDGAGGQEFIKGIISTAVKGGADLSEISKIVSEVIDNQEMQDAINKYWESLVDPNIDSEKVLQSVKKIFDDIVAKNPALKYFFDNFYNGIVAGGKAAANTISDPDKKDAFSGFSEEQTKAIDDFQSKMKTLGTALTTLRSGGDVGITDLIQEFPELQGKSDNLEEAITDLIYDCLEKLYATFDKGLPDDIRNDLQSTADAASGVAPAISTAFSNIQKSYDALNEFKKALSEDKLTDSILSNIAGLSENLNTLVAGFYSGVVTADELFDALTEHYNTDLKNYGNALIAKNLYSEEFYNAVGLASADVVNQFRDDYDIDIENCKNYNEAKIAIEEQTIEAISKRWAKYYNIQSKMFPQLPPSLTGVDSGFMSPELLPDNWNTLSAEEQKKILANPKAEYERQKAAAEKKAKEAEEALNKIVYKGSEANFKAISNSLDKDSGSGKSAEVFDFMKRQVEVLNKEIEKLQTNMDSVVGYKAKNKFADSIMSDYNRQIELYKNMMVIYQQEADKIGLSDDYVQKIKNGYGVIETIGNETLSKQVSEYQKWQDEIDSCAESIDDLHQQIKEMNYTKLDNMTDQFDQLNNSMNDVIDTSEELLELIEKSGEGVVGIEDYERLVKLQSDYALENAQYAKELKDEMRELGIAQDDVKWNEYSDQIKEYEKNMISAANAVENYKDKMVELTYKVLD